MVRKTPYKATVPEVGQLVQVRSRLWVVNELKPASIPADPSGLGSESTQNLLTLASVEDDGLGEEIQVVWEVEPGTRVIENSAMSAPSGLDDPHTLDAFLDAVRWGASSTADQKAIQSPFRSGVVLEDYQLEPIARAIQMPRVNLLIADDVGLGKTIEAGMVALELMLRHKVRKMLIVCPASLQIQWRDQMRDKFGLDFRIIDSEILRGLRRSRGIQTNPWSHFPRLITSIDYLKGERPLRQFRETLPAPTDSPYPRRWDLLIVDEAHNCAPSGKGRYATDSQRTQTVRELTPHFEHKLFLTATPHNGYTESFTSLLELVDDQRFQAGAEINRKQLEKVMVRRMKSEPEIRFDENGRCRFPVRKLDHIEVAYTDEERKAHQLLCQYTDLRKKQAVTNEQRYAADFVTKTLKKRLFSSPAAFVTTMETHVQTMKGNKGKKHASMASLERTCEPTEDDYSDDRQQEDALDDAVEQTSSLFSEPDPKLSELISQLLDWARKAKGKKDSKLKELIEWLKRNLKPDGTWNDTRVIIFTEYRDTLNWLIQTLEAEGFAGDERLLVLKGGMDPKDREKIKAAFQAPPSVSPVRILLATDAASEGIDLQKHCSRLIHYEIPWNTNRMEQRNGRVDRHGQKAETVDIYHFVGKGYRDLDNSVIYNKVDSLEADLEFLARAAQKLETQREDLGKVGTVLSARVEEAMLGKSRTLDTTQEERKAEPIRQTLRFERDLKKQIRSLVQQFNETREELRLNPENIESVVRIGLRLAGQPDLIPLSRKEPGRVFRLPAFTGSWSTCSEGLEDPHTRAVRPVTFDDSVSRDNDSIVLVHLNHRLVTMALRLLRAEVWAEKGRSKLNRVTARLVKPGLINGPAILAYGRVVVLGGDGQRLHEELIVAGGEIQKGKIASRFNQGKLDAVLQSLTDKPVGSGQASELVDMYAGLSEQLYNALEARHRDRVSSQEKRLADRAKKEEADTVEKFNELKKTIEDRLNDPEFTQQVFSKGFETAEQTQFQRHKDSMRRRLEEIPKQLQMEINLIHARYSNMQSRLFPVAASFLMPGNQ